MDWRGNGSAVNAFLIPLRVHELTYIQPQVLGTYDTERERAVPEEVYPGLR